MTLIHRADGAVYDRLISSLEALGDTPGETLASRIGRTTPEEARRMIAEWGALFRLLLGTAGYDPRDITRLTTKFRDAGRRSPPWQAGSETGNRRPQDGSDGNRQNRWLFPINHKFYADEVTATLSEVRYYLQTLSMTNAPEIPGHRLRQNYQSVLGHPLEPGAFLDPIQKVPIELDKFIMDRRYIESGHLVPLGRGGKHTPDNATLMLRQSNRMQADYTLDELLETMAGILERQGYHRQQLFK